MTIKVVYSSLLCYSWKFSVVKLLSKKLRIGYIQKCGLIMFCNPWYKPDGLKTGICKKVNLGKLPDKCCNLFRRRGLNILDK